ncbi:MAG: SPOR domain-containing protein [Pseudomonadota bacterium]|nr:SPOR domain-containing protein [Pseudomonadota bacterium]
MHQDSRRLIIFAVGLGTVLAALIGASTLMGHRSTAVPVVTADPSPVRVKPENPGGMKIDGAENDVFSGGSDIANSKLAPPAESPDAMALRIPVPPASTPSPSQPSASAPSASVLEASLPPAMRPSASTAPAVTPETPLAPPPVAKPLAVTSIPPAGPAAAAHPAPAAVETAAPPSAHQALVQLAALMSEDAARSEWQRLTKRMPELLNGRQPVFTRTERDSHTFWRVRTAGFADVAQARAFCDQVRAKGGGCSVADF